MIKSLILRWSAMCERQTMTKESPLFRWQWISSFVLVLGPFMKPKGNTNYSSVHRAWNFNQKKKKKIWIRLFSDWLKTQTAPPMTVSTLEFHQRSMRHSAIRKKKHTSIDKWFFSTQICVLFCFEHWNGHSASGDAKRFWINSFFFFFSLVRFFSSCLVSLVWWWCCYCCY